MNDKDVDVKSLIKEAQDTKKDTDRDILERRRFIEQERAEINRNRNEISKLNDDIAKLREQKADETAQWHKWNVEIRRYATEISELRKKRREATRGDKAAITAQIEDLESQQYISRQAREEVSHRRAGVSAGIQAGLGAREQHEMSISKSRVSERAASRIESEQERVLRMSPSTFRRELMAEEGLDVRKEGMRAAEDLRRRGGTRSEQAQYSKMTEEFTALFSVIRETRRAFVAMEEGTEEYAETQKKLTELTDKAADVSRKMRAMEDQVRPGRITAGGIVSGAMGIGADAFKAMGNTAAEKYVLEEERRSADIRLRTTYSEMYRQRGTSAESLIMTGGTTIPSKTFDEKGEISKPIKDLAKDLIDVRMATPGYALALKTASRMPEMIGNIQASTQEGAQRSNWGLDAGIKGASGFISGLGRETGKLATEMIKDFTTDPTLMLTSGMGKVSEKGTEAIYEGLDEFKSQMKETGKEYIKGKKNLELYNAAVDKVLDPTARVASSVTTLGSRAAGAADNMFKLQETQQQQIQTERDRERLSATRAPMIQEYMNLAGSFRGALRTRFMEPEDKKAEAKRLEKSAFSEEMMGLGFSAEDVIGAQQTAGKILGRSASGGRGIRVAETALRAEAAGLGPAAGTIQASYAAARGGRQEDPEKALEDAMSKAFKRGLTDSREFQELLEAASETSDNTGSFMGAIDRLTLMTGTGLPGEVKDARKAARTLDEEWGGTTGNIEDMVKFNIIKGSVEELEKKEGKLGKNVKRDLMWMQGLKPSEMTEEAMEAWASKDTMDMLKKHPEWLKKIQEKTLVSQVTFPGKLYSQDEEYGRKARALESRDPEKIKEEFKTEEDKRKFIETTRGAAKWGYGDPKMVRAMEQQIRNLIEGKEVKDFSEGKREDIKKKIEEGGKVVTKAESLTVERIVAGTLYAKRGEEFIKQLGAGDVIRGHKEAMTKREIDLEETVEIEEKDKIKPIGDEMKEIVKGLKDLRKSLSDVSVSSMAVNVTGDAAIKMSKGLLYGAVELGDKAGESLADAIKWVLKNKISETVSKNRSQPPNLPGKPVGQ